MFKLLADENLNGDVFVISERLSVGQAIDEILLTIECSEPSEWTDRVVRLPL